MGIVITYIDTEDKVDGKQSVRAQTSQLAGMLAAGNLLQASLRDLWVQAEERSISDVRGVHDLLQ